MCPSWWITICVAIFFSVFSLTLLYYLYRTSAKYYELYNRVDTLSSVVEGYHGYLSAHLV